MSEIPKPKTLSDLEKICDEMQWEWEYDYYGQIIIYTGLKSGPKGLEPFDDEPTAWKPTEEF